MSKLETQDPSLRPVRTRRRETVYANPNRNIGSRSRVMLVDFRSGESVHRHPEVVPLLGNGWIIKSAVPRLVENEGLKLLVVLKQAASTAG